MADILSFLYNTIPGRMILKPLTGRGLSKAAGAFLDTPLSKPLIPLFIKGSNIDLSDYETSGWRCFNDCFCRKIKKGKRPVDQISTDMITPCDGLLTVYPIEDGLVIPVKQSRYSIASLLKDKKLAEKYKGGTCFVYRLCVNHFHRYAYVDSGMKTANRFIPGRLHTVRPIALEAVPVFKQNCREYTVIDSDAFGPLVQMEVGAMLVGRIVNYKQEGMVKRGAEKGRFEYGGSTVIVLAPSGSVSVNPEILEANARGEEFSVKLGEKVGEAIL